MKLIIKLMFLTLLFTSCEKEEPLINYEFLEKDTGNWRFYERDYPVTRYNLTLVNFNDGNIILQGYGSNPDNEQLFPLSYSEYFIVDDVLFFEGGYRLFEIKKLNDISMVIEFKSTRYQFEGEYTLYRR